MPMPKPIVKRVRQLRRRLGEQGDGLLVCHALDIHYLTGFYGRDSWAYVPLHGGPLHIISDSRYQEQIQRDAPHAKVWIRDGALSVELAKVTRKLKPRRILLQRDYVTLNQHKALAKQLGSRRLRAIDDGLLEQRSIKDDDELRLIRKAIAISQQAFEQLRRFARPGMTESQVGAYLDYQLKCLGAEGPSFQTIVAADANSALPHAVPGPKRLGKRSLVQIDWGATYHGYCGDLSRMISTGPISKKLREIYAIVLEAQQAAIEVVAPGRSFADIDRAARDVIEKAGYGQQFGHGLGHGIGLNIHELPVVSGRYDKPAVVGQVVTIEPGIYLPGVGGVRIEDDLLVTPRGRRVLSDLPKTLESTMI
ncbi:MAG: aminopeptidase P family protein [Phycisphaeraceae bacterium]|nr:aminopeptidase P family protein [Phycisphaeraceae bacterium]